MVRIKGLQKTSLLDYEPYIATVIFLAGCNLRCCYCQNPDLATDNEEIAEISEKEVLEFLEQKKRWIDGVCISGGEPTIQKDLPEFIGKIKGLGLKVKLDTNGTNPEMIRELIEKGLIDYIAMDIKTREEKYKDITRTRVNTNRIKESIEIIKKKGIEHEFRITAVPGLVNDEDIKEIGKWLDRSERLYIQQFNPRICLDKNLEKIKPYSREELERMAKTAKEHFKKVSIRGV